MWWDLFEVRITNLFALIYKDAVRRVHNDEMKLRMLNNKVNLTSQSPWRQTYRCRLTWYQRIWPILCHSRILGILSIISFQIQLLIDGFQPKTSPFSVRHLILVNYKVAIQLSRPIFRSFLYLNSARHNLVIKLCLALKIFWFSFTVI